MTGCAFIVHQTGWACSNDVALDIHKESVRDEKGKIASMRQSQTFRIGGLFGTLIEDTLVDIVFKMDENSQLLGFTGRVKNVGKLTIVNILTKTDRIKEIISKI